MTNLVTLKKTTRQTDLLLRSAKTEAYTVTISAQAVQQLIEDAQNVQPILYHLSSSLENAHKSAQNGDLTFEFQKLNQVEQFLEDVQTVGFRVPLRTKTHNLMNNPHIAEESLNTQKTLVFQAIHTELHHELMKLIPPKIRGYQAP